MNENREKDHDVVFGQSFARFDAEQMIDFVKPFQTRFDANGIDASALFAGKRCLDAGCGTARGSIFMLQHGAEHVTAVDVSEKNTASAKRNLAPFGEQRFECLNSSIESLPFEDDTFDFVWCYGVIQHTAIPDNCLQEISRVLKKNGGMFVFVYGAGGIYWYVVRKLREILAELDGDDCFAILSLMRLPVYDMTTFMDDWKAAYLRCYTHDDFMTRLRELGFNDATPMPLGTPWDLNHRLNTYPDDGYLFGEGDLRYLLTKSDDRAGGDTPISASEYGSDCDFDPRIPARFDGAFGKLREAVAGNDVLAVQACAFLHGHLLPLMAAEGSFDLDGFEARLRDTVELTVRIAR
ncbi:MAG: class I SAM-dependent methyltransferase [Rhodospirillales bacterium]